MGGGKKDMDTGRKSVNGSYEQSGRKSRIPAAYPVTMLVDLQVYVVPREKWVLSRRLYRHNIVEEGISLGFVRVLPQLSIHNLRRELQLQLGPDVIPRDFIFIRAVGNIFIQLKPKQEIELKVKNFIPPFSSEPEIYLLEVLPNEDPRMISPLPLLLREDTPPHICHDLCHHSLARKIQIIRREDSPQPTTPFPPVSITPSPLPYNPMTPFSPSPPEYQSYSPRPTSRELTKSQADLARRQAAYDYENEGFESPTPTTPTPKIEKISGLPRPLIRQANIQKFESLNNDDISDMSQNTSITQTTTESPSSTDTVRTVIHKESNTATSVTTTTNETSESMSDDSVREFKKTEQETECDTKMSLSETELKNISPNMSDTQDKSNPSSGYNDSEVTKTDSKSKTVEVESITISESQESLSQVNQMVDTAFRNIEKDQTQTAYGESSNKKSTDNEEEMKINSNLEELEEEKVRETTDSQVFYESINNSKQDENQNSTVSKTITAETSTEKIEILEEFNVLEQHLEHQASTSSITSQRLDETTNEDSTQKTVNPSGNDASAQARNINKVVENIETSIERKNKFDSETLPNKEISKTRSSSPNQERNVESISSTKSKSNEEQSNEKSSSLKEEQSNLNSKSLKQDQSIRKSPTSKQEQSKSKIDVKSTSHKEQKNIVNAKSSKQGKTNGSLMTSKQSSKAKAKSTSPKDQTSNNSKSKLIKQETSKSESTSPIKYKSNTKSTLTSQEISNDKLKSSKQEKFQFKTKSSKPELNPKVNFPRQEKSNLCSTSPEKLHLKALLPKLEPSKNKSSPPIKERSNTKMTPSIKEIFKSKSISPIKEKSNSKSTSPTKEDGNNNLIKIKPMVFRDPKKPSIYPHRMTKTTIVRQALAREKRRMYVEERIQSYMKDSKNTLQNLKTYGSPYRSVSSNHIYTDTGMGHFDIKGMGKSRENYSSTFTEAKNLKMMNHLQSLPEINALNQNMKYHFYENRSYEPPQTLRALSIARSTPYSYSNSSCFARMESSDMSQSHSDPRSRSHTNLESNSLNSGIYVDSNPDLTSNFWKNVSEQGYFYTFRVRQSGTVQMVDRAVQTGEQPQSYILDFSRQSNGDKLLRDITETVQLRHDAELRRAELIQRANDLQTLVKEKRDKINRRHEFWHKKYIEESSMTRPLEAACNSLRAELNTVHRRLIAHLEGRDLPLRLRDGPSKKANYKIMAARLQHEIKELQQKAKAAKLRLESEIKLKEQGEREVRDIRNDLAHKKVVMSLARSQIGTLPAAHARAYESLVY